MHSGTKLLNAVGLAMEAIQLMSPRKWPFLALALTILAACSQNVPAADFRPSPQEFDFVGRAVLELLRTRSVDPFIHTLAVSKKDQDQLRASTVEFLSQATNCHLNFARGDWQFEITPPDPLKTIRADKESTNQFAPETFLDHLEITLIDTTHPLPPDRGAFRLLVHGLKKQAAGWTDAWRVQWSDLPTSVADARTRRELALLVKSTLHAPLTMADDPGLQQLGELWVRFLQTKDTNALVKAMLPVPAESAAFLQAVGWHVSSVSDAERIMNLRVIPNVLADANSLLQQSDVVGIDLSQAEVHLKDIRIGYCQTITPRGYQRGDWVRADRFRLIVDVKMAARAKNGAALAGEYQLAAIRAERVLGRWVLAGVSENPVLVHWATVPPGAVDEHAVKSMANLTYLTEHGELPPGAAIPDFSFTAIADGHTEKISDLRGKTVVLDFWATWCGPCQSLLADEQSLLAKHPGWRDRVVILSMSVDDKMETVQKHLATRGWTNTFNAWAGSGVFLSAPAQALHVRELPTLYVIDPQGFIVGDGGILPSYIAKLVDQTLEKTGASRNDGLIRKVK